MVSRRKKIVKRLLESLNRVSKPDGKPGRLIKERTISHSKKDRKRKGHKEGHIIDPKMKWKDVISECIEPIKYFDDWCDYRDSFRYHTSTDQLYHRSRSKGIAKETILAQNNKIKKQIKVRLAKLESKRIKNDK